MYPIFITSNTCQMYIWMKWPFCICVTCIIYIQLHWNAHAFCYPGSMTTLFQSNYYKIRLILTWHVYDVCVIFLLICIHFFFFLYRAGSLKYCHEQPWLHELPVTTFIYTPWWSIPPDANLPHSVFHNVSVWSSYSTWISRDFDVCLQNRS